MEQEHSGPTSDVWQKSEINTYNSISTFMRCPSDFGDDGYADVVISGIPFDLATTYRPGARFGPGAIRAASAQLARRKMFPWGFNPLERIRGVDLGDLQLDAHHPLAIYDQICTHGLSILQRGVKLLSFGGDHYVSYPLLAAFAEFNGQPMRLLHFDAHTDTWPDECRESISHGTMFYKAVKEGLIDVDHSVQVGIRTWNDDTLGIHQMPAPMVHEFSEKDLVGRIREILGDGPVYLTFDIDCLDPASAPGTGTPVLGGLSSPQVLGILRGLEGLNLVGADVVEVAPIYDHGEITAIAAAHIAGEILCLFATSSPHK